jgi:GNAT superfamily N-acetyltransferase
VNLGLFVTRSGEPVKLRFVDKGDAALLVDLFFRLSPESKRLRFHLYTTKIPRERIWAEAEQLSNLDSARQRAIVATITEDDGQEHAVGVARFARKSATATEAEVAVVVRDDFQRRGLGKHLLVTLAEEARKMDITHFTAWVMSDNYRLMKLIRGMEIKDLEADSKYGEIKIRAPIF